MLFGSTHLDYKKESKSRILQVKRLIEHSKSSPIPIIIAGDFNASSGSETINLMDSEFTRTCNSCPPTIPVNNPSRVIDFIFYKHPQDKLDVKLHKVIDEKYASDHLPVYAEVIIEH
ncbi:endonuclease/exonuclease/phosphatase family protein [Salegentibacter maritimus]|uniref:endonuclease/exonuclease/phosphatase family protein n=1 Tax=Salegentibacter maritimus TaxID=2794347 RepID=UPI0018E453A2|nr:endonuclease/exonuclease/phosphatase family protein [Salegentibacter maritimus]